MNRPIRVAMIIQAYLPHVGGAEKQLAALAPLLQAQGVELHILTRRYPGMKPFESVNQVPVHRLPVPGPKPVAAFSFTLSALPLLWRLRPDVIHAHELLSPTTTAIAAKRWLRAPVVAKVLRGGQLGDIAKLKGKPMGQQRLTSCRRHVDAFITISQEIDRELAGLGVPPERRPFIPNGVDTGRFRPLAPAAKQALRASLGLPRGPVVIFTGRLAPEKQVDQLLQIWPTVQASHAEALLLIVGRGEEEKALRQKAGPGVHFAGQVEDVAPYLQAADLFVLPSSAEGLSNALLEGMATGLPAVATAVGGAPDVIDHLENGWLVPPNHLPALQEALLELLSKPTQRTALGEAARQRIEQQYSLTSTAARLLLLYKTMMDRTLDSRG
jgi:glycosyltransferase involved in cell wall biosynthesis